MFHQRFLFFLCLFFLVGSACFHWQTVEGLRTSVDARSTLELYDEVAQEHILSFQFEFPASTYAPRVTVSINGEVKEQWNDNFSGVVSITGKSENIKSNPQMVIVTIENESSSPVDMNFALTTSIDFSNVGSEDMIDPIEAHVRGMGLSLDRLKTIQMNLQAEQRRHRRTVDSSSGRVLWWSTLQVVTLLVISAINLFFFKRFLEKRTFF